MQIQADLLEVPLLRPQETESTALGAACLAGLATNVWADKESVSTQWRTQAKFIPERKRSTVKTCGKSGKWP